MSYLIPAAYSGMSSWSAHQRRNPPSSEPGTDYYMPRGTVLRAPARCRVVGVGGGIQPATGRFVTVDDGTRWIRFLHMLRQDVRVGDELDPGEAFGLSGASGYGSEHFGAASDTDPAMIRRTGGPHVHVTAFRGRGYTFGSAGTVDFHALTGGAVAGGGGSAAPEDEMDAEERNALFSIYKALFFGGGDAGDQSVISRIVENQQNLRAIGPRVINLDQQVTGADGFDTNVGPSVAGRLIAVQQALVGLGAPEVDPAELAASLAPVLAPLLGDHLATLTDDEISRLAKAAADEADRRAKARLDSPA